MFLERSRILLIWKPGFAFSEGPWNTKPDIPNEAIAVCIVLVMFFSFENRIYKRRSVPKRRKPDLCLSKRRRIKIRKPSVCEADGFYCLKKNVCLCVCEKSNYSETTSKLKSTRTSLCNLIFAVYEPTSLTLSPAKRICLRSMSKPSFAIASAN